MLDGLPEETEPTPNEMDPGDFLAINDNDDNANDVADGSEYPVDLADPDLVPLTLSFPADYKPDTEVTLSMTGAGSFRLWSADGTQLLGLMADQSVRDTVVLSPSQGPTMQAYLEAIAPGATVLTLLAADAGTTRPSTTQDSAKAQAEDNLDVLTVSHNNHDGAQLPDGQEDRPGAFVPLNNDDDDYDYYDQNNGTKTDKDQTGAITGEDDLLPIIIRTPADANGQYKLTGTGIKIYQNADRSNPQALGQGFNIPANDLKLYVEGTTQGASTRSDCGEASGTNGSRWTRSR